MSVRHPSRGRADFVFYRKKNEHTIDGSTAFKCKLWLKL